MAPLRPIWQVTTSTKKWDPPNSCPNMDQDSIVRGDEVQMCLNILVRQLCPFCKVSMSSDREVGQPTMMGRPHVVGKIPGASRILAAGTFEIDSEQCDCDVLNSCGKSGKFYLRQLICHVFSRLLVR